MNTNATDTLYCSRVTMSLQRLYLLCYYSNISNWSAGPVEARLRLRNFSANNYSNIPPKNLALYVIALLLQPSLTAIILTV